MSHMRDGSPEMNPPDEYIDQLRDSDGVNETIQSNEAQRGFKEVLDQVEHRGQIVAILRYKNVAAVMTPGDWHARAEQALRNQVAIRNVLAKVLSSETADRQYALEEIERILA